MRRGWFALHQKALQPRPWMLDDGTLNLSFIVHRRQSIFFLSVPGCIGNVYDVLIHTPYIAKKNALH